MKITFKKENILKHRNFLMRSAAIDNGRISA